MQGKTELASQYFACLISCLLISGNGVADQEQSPPRRPATRASPHPVRGRFPCWRRAERQAIGAAMLVPPAPPPAPLYVCDADSPRRLERALEDLATGFRRWRLPTALARLDIRNRYRGSVLGPFW